MTQQDGLPVAMFEIKYLIDLTGSREWHYLGDCMQADYQKPKKPVVLTIISTLPDMDSNTCSELVGGEWAVPYSAKAGVKSRTAPAGSTRTRSPFDCRHPFAWMSICSLLNDTIVGSALAAFTSISTYLVSLCDRPIFPQNSL